MTETIFVKFIRAGKEITHETHGSSKQARRSLRERGLSVKEAEKVEGGYIFTLGEGEEVIAAAGKTRYRKKKGERSSQSPTIVGSPNFMGYDNTPSASLNLKRETPDELIATGKWKWVTKPVKDIAEGDIIYFGNVKEGEGVYLQVKGFFEHRSNERTCFKISVQESPLTYALPLEDEFQFLVPIEV